ncbi:RNA polymerase sigma-70 factor (ECF subfamily) [Nocardioides luteus]|uniref:DNA-directed RNA polymerase sigma-70 factor n=1 Tax=Nocardioides luteus TaxID=1844 RepID=A0ABQ5SSK5_9ACTN|nr:RNA polymerase sigma-70 factor [Nocardioides luteus]MDR7310112.1 RNA polymerase sigma-70 factor (ECF subfamily) [Nocardioides luteus]GGR64714.1 DNA-directed RNA polymerase sigma-70 factor [Nocardioides luteus]GLJ66980.1 DNA-directed RNA polymerase sigma-70 factor [Nocardioides luteus]
MDLATAHDGLRPLMFSIAYRMLGSVAEAEDVVQEAFLRMHRAQQSGEDVDNLDAYATTVTTRVAIDTLRSARHRREQYVGPWLPEPILVTDEDPAHRFELDETVSTAFLVLLESLTPVERAVFVLREVIGYDYEEIAAVVDKSATNCRQIFTRARRRVADGTPRFDPSPERREELAARFVAALSASDVAGLERLLADDVVFVADGGGRAPAIQKPMLGAVAVARFLLGLMRQGERFGVRLELSYANGQPAMLTRGADGALLGVVALDVEDGRIVRLHNVLNPDKLGHLGQVGDLFALLGQR